jgi:hypothetical protein
MGEGNVFAVAFLIDNPAAALGFVFRYICNLSRTHPAICPAAVPV